MATILHLNRWKINSWSKENKSDKVKLCCYAYHNTWVSYSFLYTIDITIGLLFKGKEITYQQQQKSTITKSFASLFYLPLLTFAYSPGGDILIRTSKLSFCLCFVGKKESHHLKMGSFHTWAVPCSSVPTPSNSSKKSKRSMATFSLAE